MTQNLDNAIHGIQEARTALMVETGNSLITMEQEQALEEIQVKLNEVESMIRTYD